MFYRMRHCHPFIKDGSKGWIMLAPQKITFRTWLKELFYGRSCCQQAYKEASQFKEKDGSGSEKGQAPGTNYSFEFYKSEKTE